MQLTVITNAKKQIALPLYSGEVEKIERRFEAFAATAKRVPAEFAEDMVLALDALGPDDDLLMRECQYCGLLYFALTRRSSVPTRPGLVKDYIEVHDFCVVIECDHPNAGLSWHVTRTDDRPN